MKTKFIQLDCNNIDNLKIIEAAEILKQGGLVAFPTETVYGLGADGLNEEASSKIYAAKGRPSDNPLILHISSMKALDALTAGDCTLGRKLAEAFWPGPLTLIFKKSSLVPLTTTGGLDTVAIRMPAHPIAYELIRQAGLYIAAPSANASGRPSPTTAVHVLEDMDGRIDMILDGGSADIGLESTIVDVSAEIPVILRPGYITLEDIIGITGEAEYDKGLFQKPESEDFKPKAPGMKYKHYAPRGQLTIYEGENKAVVRAINQAAEEKLKEGYRVGIIATDETLSSYQKGLIKTIGTRKDEKTIAAGLFKILRDFDGEQADYIYSESFYDNHLGQAIMNRLLKAAGYHIEKV